MNWADLLTIATPTALLTGGVAWGTVKATLNGTKARVERIETKVDDIDRRLSRMEGAHTGQGGSRGVG